MRRSNYDKHPVAPVGLRAECHQGWTAILEKLQGLRTRTRCVLAVECYPGVRVGEVKQAFTNGLAPILVVDVRQAYLHASDIDRMCAPYMGNDAGFGRMNGLSLAEFFDPGRRASLRSRIEKTREGLALVVGAGASLLVEPDVLIYADMARFEIRQRQKRHEPTAIAVDDHTEDPRLQYKRGFFVDWRAADRLKRKALATLDFFVDTNDPKRPRMITGDDLRRGLAETVSRPFRLVPAFDSGAWGGRWLKSVCDLSDEAPNYASCFDCVPEENSLLMGFGEDRVEVPALDLVFRHPRELLGEAVHARFGSEFPIRFDLLDTMDGENLPLHVHPLTELIQDRFGVPYTQDESYYLLDAAPDACVYLGLREEIDENAMVGDLTRALERGVRFPDEEYVNRFRARKHDHFLIPGGTVHSSGKGAMVLEIGAAPHLFAFNLWSWGQLELDGRPGPIHLDDGVASIQWERTTGWVERELVNRIEPLANGPGWRAERTGLHERGFIETRRHWFTGTVPHDTGGGVNVLNLVQGEEAAVESPSEAFEPFVVHYAETFVVPAVVGPYTIRPRGSGKSDECATIKASVRTRA